MKKLLLLSTLIFTAILNASPFAKPSEPNGILNLATPHTSRDIFPVVINNIDGRNVPDRSNAVWLTPGKHSIRVRAVVVNLNSRSHALTRRQTKINRINRTLELTVEEGKTYYIGYDTSGRNPNDWKAVVWKVK